ncbi:phosphatase PAP2 family protein [Streptomyces sp. NPDC053048]|uniref:phosphatase PAP2 family protein n=1 Tax=Streptomyces sp. NPDC053048 TaxID=3365694 RepID=UPI0037D37113
MSGLPFPPLLHLRPAEKVTLAYLAASTVLVVVGRRRVPGARRVLAGYTVTAAAVAVCAYAQPRSSSRALFRTRAVLPLACTGWLFPASGRQALALYGRLLDNEMLVWERRAFGCHPNLACDKIAWRALNEALTVAYSSYYLYFAVPPFHLARTGRDRDLERYVLAICLAQYCCFLGFAVLPLAGPIAALRASFDPPRLTGYLAVPAQTWLMDRADPPGTCFPSSHVAGAWAATLTALPVLPRPAARTMAAVTTALTVSVVHCRYHYVVDAVAGLAIAALAHRAAPRLLRGGSAA